MLLSTLALVLAPQVIPPTDDSEAHPKLAATPSAILRHAANAAAKMPLDPHRKTRARLQYELVEAALASGHVKLARDVTEEVENWRGALCKAAIAAHLAEAGEEQAARRALERAETAEVALIAEFEQGWRRDRVRARIARTYAFLGDPARAASIQAKLESSEAGRLAPLSTRFIEEEDDAATQVETLTSIAGVGDLEQVRHSLLALAAIYGRFSDAQELRKTVVESIRNLWNKMPLEPRIEVLEQLVRHDVDLGTESSLAAARSFLDEIEAMVTDHGWTPERDVALRADVAKLRVLTGEVEQARASLERALHLYTRTRDSIIDIDRSDALRPIAEAYAVMGDRRGANETWIRGLEECLANPNARPRLEDLVATAISIAKSGVEPNPRLLKMLERVDGLLVAPW